MKHLFVYQSQMTFHGIGIIYKGTNSVLWRDNVCGNALSAIGNSKMRIKVIIVEKSP